MKKIIFPVAAVYGFMCLLSCNNGQDKDTIITDTVKSATSAADAAMASDTSSAKSYKDLGTGAAVKLKKNNETGKYINTETNAPVEFYYDPATNDTFDVSGRNVNMAITKDKEGKYMVDEAKVKIQSDGDAKLKSADGETKVKIETNGDVKIKTDSTKIKIRNGEVRVKKG